MGRMVDEQVSGQANGQAYEWVEGRTHTHVGRQLYICAGRQLGGHAARALVNSPCL